MVMVRTSNLFSVIMRLVSKISSMVIKPMRPFSPKFSHTVCITLKMS